MDSSSRLSDDVFAAWAAETGRNELRQILFWRWDPIAVDDSFPATADEYDSYLPGLLSRLRGATPDDIVAFLLNIERTQMSQRFSSDAKLGEVAEFITGWFIESVDVWQTQRRKTS